MEDKRITAGWRKILGHLFNKHEGALRHEELFPVLLVEVAGAG